MERASNDIDDTQETVRRRILRTPGAADYVGLSPSTLEKLRLTRRGPRFVRLGQKAVGYDINDLDRWLDGQRDQTSDDVDRDAD